MAGVLLQDGLSGGASPTLKVLEIGAVDAKRHESDLLPYLPQFRSLFEHFPTTANQISNKIINLMLEDVEAVTVTTVKTKGPHWYIKIPKGANPPRFPNPHGEILMLVARTTTLHRG